MENEKQAARATPAQPERDERAAFEMTISSGERMRHPKYHECYADASVQAKWSGWQARAALSSRTPTTVASAPITTWITPYDKRADEAGVTVRTKESLFDYALAEISDLRAVCKHDASEQQYIAQRLRRVAQVADVPVHGDDAFVYGAAFALLGQIALALESNSSPAAPSPSSVGDAIRALPLPEPFWDDEDFCGYNQHQMRKLRSEAAALAEQVQGQQVPEGWKLVPKEPTKEMIFAIAHDEYPADLHVGKAAQRRLGLDVIPPRVEYEIAYGQYCRLLAAAPSIAQDGQKSEADHA